MRVCTSRQMAAIDSETIAAGVTGSELMERAGRALTEVLMDFLAAQAAGDHEGCGHDHGRDAASDPAVLLVCGKGNNGGDGLVMARLLGAAGVPATVMLLSPPEELSPDAALNHGLLPAGVSVTVAAPHDWARTFVALAEDADVVVDAIFGTGVTHPLRPAHAALIETMNDVALPCFAVDVPSGVDGDNGRVDPVSVAADLTATVGLPKLGLLLPPGRDFAGDVEVVDIGFASEVCERHTSDLHWLPRDAYLSMLPPRPTSLHKYECGRLLAVAGSRAFGGAAHLAVLGGLRSGAGLVTLAIPEGLTTALRAGLPEAIIAPLAETPDGTIAPVAPDAMAALLSRVDALAVGPGLGSDPDTDRWVCEMVDQLPDGLPLVLDADGLGAFARGGRSLDLSGRPAVVTPHPGEFARLTGLPATEIAARRLEMAGEYAQETGAVVVLKGSPTAIGWPDGRVHLNPSGDDALARGGSGDVLTGLIGGLLAQGLAAGEAALLGCYVHGLAGTHAALGMSSRAVLVREIAAAIGPVLLSMEQDASGDGALRERIWPVRRPEADA